MAKKRRKTATTAAKSRKAPSRKMSRKASKKKTAKRSAKRSVRRAAPRRAAPRRSAPRPSAPRRAPAAPQAQPASLDTNTEQTLPLDDVQLPS